MPHRAERRRILVNRHTSFGFCVARIHCDIIRGQLDPDPNATSLCKGDRYTRMVGNASQVYFRFRMGDLPP